MNTGISSNISTTSYAVDNIPHQDTGKTTLKYHFVQRNVSSAFRALGTSIGRHPLLYCLVPLLVAAALSLRIYWVRLTKDVEYLYSPINARAMREREAIESIFPPTTDGLDMLTLTSLRGVATVMIEAKDGGSVLRDDIMREAVRIDNIVYNITVFQRSKRYTYADLCSKQYSGECQSNNVLDLLGKTEDIMEKQLRIRYPADMNVISKHVSIYAVGLGGVTTDENNYIMDAKAIRLIYILDQRIIEKDKLGLKWEEAFLEVISKIRSDLLKLSFATAESINNEFSRVTEMALPLVLVTAFTMTAFAAVSCMTTNWVSSKPWVAIAGCISPVLGGASAFGFLLLCGFEYVDLNTVIFFLLVGIGLDDSFVILAAWRRTDSRQEVDVRMSQAYEEAAVSITITSITNILSLCVGMSIPTRIVRIYCCYAATSMFFAYIYQVTFFGGVLALSGYREKRNLHPLLCIAVKKERIPNSPLLKFLYFGCTKNESVDGRNEDSKSPFLKNFLRLITTAWGKSIVVAAFLLYLITSAYCLRFVKEGFDYRDAIPSYSYLVDYFNIHYKHFSQYPHVIHVVINKTLDYSDKQVQKDIDDMMQSFSNGPNMAGNNYTISWLKYYLQSTRESMLQLLYRGYNISQPNEFVAGLRDVFLKLPYARLFRKHIRFNDNETEIVATRFIVFSKNVSTSDEEKRLLSTIFSKADSCKYPTNVYNIWFPFCSILVDITSTTLETMYTAAFTVIAVFFVFIPHLVCIIGIVVTIISIQIGVIGYMSLWNVNFSPISMICIVISIGLSIDYAAHISYAYLSCIKESPNEKTKTALCKAGYPIIQGCVSTVLGVAIFGFGPSNIFLIFFKVVSLVMLIAVFHGLFVIPVMLNVFEVILRELYNKWQRTSQGRQPSCDDNKHRRKESILDNIADDKDTSLDISL